MQYSSVDSLQAQCQLGVLSYEARLDVTYRKIVRLVRLLDFSSRTRRP